MVDLNYNFKCDWFVELSYNKLSDNKLSDNNLASELVGNRSFFKPITIEEIVIFMISKENELKDFYFKFLHRIIVRKQELCYFGIESNANCMYCDEGDSVDHTFLHCPTSKFFFNQVLSFMV